MSCALTWVRILRYQHPAATCVATLNSQERILRLHIVAQISANECDFDWRAHMNTRVGINCDVSK